MLKCAIIIICLISLGSAWTLNPCNDTQKLDGVQELIDGYHFKYKWQNDTFDCVDMAAANWQFLKAAGYEPQIAICKYNDDGGSHCYVIFPLGDGWAGVETRLSKLRDKSLDNSLGKVITDLEGHRVLANPEDLYAYDPRGPPLITGEVIEPNPVLPPTFR